MYEAFYKLKASPFQLAPDSQFFYDSDTHRRALIKLRQSLRDRIAVTVVHGEPGTGKSELMKKFISEFDESTTVVANLPLTSVRSSNILDYIASAFGVINMGFVGDALWSASSLIGKIQQEVSVQATEGKKFVVFIDNAESLSKSCLKKLLQLCGNCAGGKPLIQCFLFGETAVGQKGLLKPSEGIDGFIESIELDVLSEQDARRYVEHRLMEAGWQGDPEITDNAYSSIFQITEGVPWHINLLCHRLLLQGFLQDTHVIDDTLVKMFSDDQQVPHQEVAGSDVAHGSNVVNLYAEQTGRSTKGTSSYSTVNRETELATGVQPREKKDSISYFFDESPAEVFVDEFDDVTISVDDVEQAYASSLGTESRSQDNFQESILASASDELFFPESSDEDEGEDIKDVENKPDSSSEGIQQTITRASSDEDKMTASILERIFPKTMAMMEEYAQEPPPRSYPVMDLPDEEPANVPQQNENELMPENESDVYQDLPAGKSSFEIATRASIVTSLVITLVMWVVSDTRTANETTLRAVQASQSNVNSVTPSPFRNPNDLPRERTILGN